MCLQDAACGGTDVAAQAGVGGAAAEGQAGEAAASAGPMVGGAVKKGWQASNTLVEGVEEVLFGKEPQQAGGLCDPRVSAC